LGTLADIQRQRNLDSQNCWQAFHNHRAAVTDALCSAASSTGQRLCVLGAGNCNDLDLQVLGKRYAEVVLVDIDSQALAAGKTLQNADPLDHVRSCGGIDLTGVMDVVDRWTPGAPGSDDEIDRCIERAKAFAAPQIGGPFDVVGSVCLLTQIIEMPVLALGPKHPRLHELIFALRDRHLQMLAELVRPGGHGVLITDFVSSDTLPELASIPEDRFEQAIGEQIERRNFFTGANRIALFSLFQTAPLLSPLVSDCKLMRPWRWTLGPRTYAVSGIAFKRRS